MDGISISRILLPTDFSELGGEAVAYACGLAEKFNSELHLLHVVQDLVVMVPEPGIAVPPPGVYLEDLRASAVEALEKVLPAGWEAGHRVVKATREGAPFLEILTYAKEFDVDLIVLGTHGRSGLAHVLLGSVTERVVRKARCPVLTVRAKGHEYKHP